MVGLAEALLQQKRYDEAERLFITAQISAPENRNVAAALARVAVGREDWEDAERRWSAVLRRFPNASLAWHGLASARWKRRDIVGTEIILEEALGRFSSDGPLLALFATMANEAQNWPEAERRWARVRAVAPHNPMFWLLHINALRAQSRDDDADKLLGEAVEAFPDHIEFNSLFLKSNVAAENWFNASIASRRIAEANPDGGLFIIRAFEMAWRALGSIDTDEAERVLATSMSFRTGDAQKLLSQFQGFGEDQEFAIVQRHFGTEPLTLLRFADISTRQLTAALQSNLEGIGEPENTSLDLGADYIIRDLRYQFAAHTFIKKKPADPQKFFSDQCMRVRYLSEEFLDDLKDGGKIFVYKSSSADEASEVERLHAAMARHGYATLLYVRLSADEHRHTTVKLVKSGLLYGYLDRLFDEQKPSEIDFQGWLDLCRNAVALVDGRTIDDLETPLNKLFLRFESMGNNCEFGLVQRRYGAEPLGWLRWSRTTLGAVTEAIEEGIVGFGDPSRTEITTPDDYLAVDDRYGLCMRTFLRGDHTTHGKFLTEQCRRMKLLRKRLIHDLHTGQIIFVNKTNESVALDDVMALHQAVRNYGPAKLLHVRPPDEDNPSETVRSVAPGLFVGYLDGLVARGGFWNVNYAGWLEICRKSANFEGRTF
jgi:hypothetical protein